VNFKRSWQQKSLARSNDRRLQHPGIKIRNARLREWLSLKILAVVYTGRHPEWSRFSGVVRDLACSKSR
jgi:hypothetical protein